MKSIRNMKKTIFNKKKKITFYIYRKFVYPRNGNMARLNLKFLVVFKCRHCVTSVPTPTPSDKFLLVLPVKSTCSEVQFD